MKKYLALFYVLFTLLVVGTAQASDAVLSWSAPTERENGEALTVAELGGYEIRAYLNGSAGFTAIVVPDGSATSFRFAQLPAGQHLFEIAAFDTNGLYSNFVPITYTRKASPGSPGGVGVSPVGHDVIAACLAEGPPRCRVAVTGEW